MKIKSKRHPDRQELSFRLQNHYSELAVWAEVYPINPADFTAPPPISAVELQKTVDELKHDIIAYSQLLWAGTNIPVTSSIKFHTRYTK